MASGVDRAVVVANAQIATRREAELRVQDIGHLGLERAEVGASHNNRIDGRTGSSYGGEAGVPSLSLPGNVLPTTISADPSVRSGP